MFACAITFDWVVTFTLSASNMSLFGSVAPISLVVTFDTLIVACVGELDATFTVVLVDSRLMFIGDVLEMVPLSVTLEFGVTIGTIVVLVDVVVEVEVEDVEDVVQLPPGHTDVVGAVVEVVEVVVEVVVVGIVVVVVDLDVVDVDAVVVEVVDTIE
jgi:hypothetical protein